MADFDLSSPHTVLLMCGYGPVGDPGDQPGPTFPLLSSRFRDAYWPGSPCNCLSSPISQGPLPV
jgi:hypothetical protein